MVEKEYARARAQYEWRDLEAADGWHGRRPVGDRLMNSSELQDLIVEDRDSRLDYLAGILQIGGASTLELEAPRAAAR